MVLLIYRAVLLSKLICRIYIPLWFYLYEEFGEIRTVTIEFTFHYGSTYIIPALGDREVARLFTFHYGSTYMEVV